MDIQAMASQLMGFLGDNPDLLGQFVEHPYSTTAEATNTDEKISKSDMSQIVTQVAAQATGQSFDMGDVAGIASTLLGQNGGSVHALTSALFGGAGNGKPDSVGDLVTKSVLGGAMARGAGSILSSALGLGKK